MFIESIKAAEMENVKMERLGGKVQFAIQKERYARGWKDWY